MGQFSNEVIELVGRAAAEQAGIISGDNPASYNKTDPLRLWVIQVTIIILFTQLLSVLLARIRQPRVIAEVIGGVLLGPTVMGRIPNFTNTIFPSQSIPLLALTANIGLVYFLFLVGMEIDTSTMRHNAKAAAFISVSGLIIPLGLGAALAVPIYHTFINPDVNMGYFVLFVAVAVGITAFPVLCRILTETRLLDTPVGVTTLAAGVGNDVVGWILLALAVALANASSGLTALWVLLTGVAFVLFMVFPVKWTFRWVTQKTGSLEDGRPTPLLMTVTLLMVLVSAFFTDIIGIHAIFGGFIAGLIIPKKGGFAIALVEKLEDLISLIFLPIYFTQSGLNTNLGLLNTGQTWGYVVLICVVAFFAKFLPCSIAAKLNGFTFRESGAIGTLMSCKGLVELIVLNVGLQAQILDTRTFSMFVLHAIVLTFMTTPLTLLWYPVRIRTRISQVLKENPTDAQKLTGGHSSFEGAPKTNFAIILNRAEHLPAVMTFTQLLHRPSINHRHSLSSSNESIHQEKTVAHSQTPVQLSALRLVELTERTSDVLRSQDAIALASVDALLSIVRASGRMHRLPVAGELAVVPPDEFAQRIGVFVNERGAEMVVLPWTLAMAPSSGPVVMNTDDHGVSVMSPTSSGLHNPFEGIFTTSSSVGSASVVYSSFVRRVFTESPVDVALFIDRTSSSPDVSVMDTMGSFDGHHIFLPFFGGPDDRLALELLVQLCANPAVRATVVRINITEDDISTAIDNVEQEKAAALANFTVHGPANGADTVYGAHTTQTRLQSDTADDIAWSRYASSNSVSTHLPSTVDALRRITFHSISSSQPLRAALTHVAADPESIVIVGRGKRLARTTHRAELKRLLVAAGHGPRDAGAAAGEMSRTVGDIAAAFLLAPQSQTNAAAEKPRSGMGAVLVVQAAENRGLGV